jgi:hypothetical protein
MIKLRNDTVSAAEMINVKSDVRMGEEAVMAYQRILS